MSGPLGPQVAFEGSAGTILADPLGVAPRPFTVDTSAAALLFAPPALTGEFLPASLWQGTRLARPAPTPPCPPHPDSATRPDWAEWFHSAVVSACGDAECIGVQLSGGLDSLAVLVHTLRVARREGRRVVALTHDLCDDRGHAAGPVTRRLLRRLGLTCEHITLDPSEHAEPRWSPVGPRMDALPEANAGLSRRAEALGVQVLLTGEAADELLGTPRFAAWQITRAHGARAGARYLADVARTAPGWPGEALAVAARALPASVSARMYWATNWPEWCSFEPSTLLASQHREPVAHYSRDWVRNQIAMHSEHIATTGWAGADAYDSFWPHDPIPPAGAVAVRSPFLDPNFLAAALAAPPAARYDPRLPVAYHRYKAAVVGLFPRQMRSQLPQRKQYFRHALASAAARPLRAERAIAAGILDPDALAAETDTAALMTVRALEDWLAGAEQRGVAIPGVCSASPPPLTQ